MRRTIAEQIGTMIHEYYKATGRNPGHIVTSPKEMARLRRETARRVQFSPEEIVSVDGVRIIENSSCTPGIMWAMEAPQ